MAHRNSDKIPTSRSHPFHRSNPPIPNTQLHLERRMLAPTENTVFNHTVRLPNPHPSNSVVFHGQYHHSLSAASSSQSSTNPAQYGPYRYDQRSYVNCANVVSPQEENVRVTFKRKHPSTHSTYHNDHGYYSTGSNIQLKPQSSTSATTTHLSDNFLSFSEQYQRNVRSRHGDALFNPSWQSSSYPSHQLFTSVNNSSFNVVGQWDFPPLPGSHAQLIHPTGAALSSFSMNHSVPGNVITAANTNNHGAFYSELCRNQNFMLPTSQAPTPRWTVAGPSRYNHRQISASTFKDSAPSVSRSITFPRNLRSLNSNGGLRISNEAHRLFSENEHVRWTSEGSAMIDLRSYVNPLDLFDEYRDLRLDIDDMSYEELLALEDRIGKVNTGLSEDQLSLCLTKTIYCSSSLEDQVESSCTICLEEYKDKDNIGMLKCLHTYHVSCINDWLRMKNSCPICKSPALEDMS